jgi:hypothetical protein
VTEGVKKMNKEFVKKLIHEELAKCGIVMPIEETFDYTNIDQPEKTKQFVKLVHGQWQNGIYVKKTCSNDCLPGNYYDLLFTVAESGIPICLPVPVAERLWHENVIPGQCRSIITGQVYESIYRFYYEKNEIPF